MSIVERALGKLQSGASIAAEPRTRDSAPAPVAPVTHAEPAPVRRTRIEPRETIHVNLEHIRAQGMLPPHELMTRLADEFRRIKWPLLTAARQQGAVARGRGSIIMVTSSVPAEGKSFVALNLGLSIAVERDCRVVLVDTDCAKARLTRLFGLESRPGLTDYLQGDCSSLSEIVIGTDIVGLSILPVGRPDAASPELYASRRMESLLGALAAEDPDAVLLLDSSPLLAKNEAQVLARLADQILVIVRADHTPQPVVNDALALLDRSRPISIVLNQVHADWFGKYHGHYHYRYESNES